MPISVPAIALFASPPSGACSSSHISGQPTSSGFLDYDFNPRPPSSTTSAPSTIQKPMAGGLSCLFSSPPSARHVTASSSPFASGDELNTLWHDRSEDLSCSYSYKSRTHTPSPISVFHGPVSGSPSSSSTRIPRESIGRERSSSGFERHAMSSYLDYELPSFSSVPTKEEVGLGEFAFVMEDLVVGSDTSCEAYAKDMLSDAQSKHKIFTNDFVVKAFYEAEKAHRGQMRASGDPYLQHCVDTALLLADVGANATVVAAGLLHDTLDDCSIDHDYISARFGTGVADLVDGVSKLSHLSKLARENNTADKFAEADRLHTMFLAMTDARAVLVKLADRLHNMMTLEALPLIKQMRFAKETLEIFAPLANRLGISSWKEQLENLCFKHLNPEQHMDLSSKVVRSFDESTIASGKLKLEDALDEAGVSYHVICGRHKSLYSIYSKMLKKKLNMDEIHDIHGLRLIVENEYDCYKALDVVHGLWPQVTGRFKDYITHPKFNGYQSLHTVVMSECSVPLEVQIRTKEMHLQAEYGFAAHWRYKEGDCMHSKSVLQMVEWARWVVTWQCLAMNNDSGCLFSDSDLVRPPCPFPSHLEDCPFSYKPQNAHNGPVFVILLENEKMSVQEFPAHSTLMDLFERHGRGSSRWSGYSFPRKEELRPRLNHEPVAPLDRFRKLKMGDVVELTPPIPDKSLRGYRDEIQRMYDSDVAISSKIPCRS